MGVVSAVAVQELGSESTSIGRRLGATVGLTQAEVRELRHEIANALAASSGYTQFLLLRLPDWADERERRALLAIQAGLRQAFQLLGSAAGTAEGSPGCRLATVLDQAISQIPPERIDDVRVRFHGTADVVGEWRGERITQILANLLSNAAKYSEAGTPIEVEVTRHPRCVRIIVRDRGIGIGEEHLEAIFHGFRTGRAQQKSAGSGIGLQLSRRLARAEGGDIWATSVLGEGSAFYLELPCPDAAGQ